MIVLFLIIAVVAVIVGIILWFIEDKKSYCTPLYNLALGLIIGGIIFLVFNGIFAICMGYEVTKSNYVNEKVTLYQTENDRIENEISTIVENYKNYEKSTFGELKSKDVTTMVTLFPELKSDNLVKKQIDIYNNNKKKIVELKEEIINAKPLRWWLYFGT